MKWLVELLELLGNVLAGQYTKEEMAKAGASRETLKTAATIKTTLPSFYSAQKEEDRWRVEAIAFARTQLGKHYRFGVEVQPGQEDETDDWDCSEFTEGCARVAHWSPALPDGAWQQYEVCRPVNLPEAGDLGFLWSDKRGMIGHSMLYTGEGTVIHAVAGRGVVEDPVSMWENHPRFRGWRRPPCFSMRRHDLAG